MHDLLGRLPENVSTYGARIDSMYYLILFITAAIFFLVQATLLVFLFRYRSGRPGRATYTHGNTRLEVIWTTVPAIIVIMLGFMSRGLWAEIKTDMPPADVTIKVTGKQFNWEILYSGPDGQFGTPDDYQVDNDLKVPLDKTIHVVLASHDVIHSFFVPQVRLKQDALPGREITAWFRVTKPGVYEIPCAELCGFGHSGMKGTLTVLSPDDYAKWLAEQWPPAGAAEGAQAPAGEAPDAAPEAGAPAETAPAPPSEPQG